MLPECSTHRGLVLLHAVVFLHQLLQVGLVAELHHEVIVELLQRLLQRLVLVHVGRSADYQKYILI